MEYTIIILYIIRLLMYYKLIEKYKLGDPGNTIFFYIEVISILVVILFAVDAKTTLIQVYEKYWQNLPFKRKLMYILLVVSIVYGLFVDYTRGYVIANGMRNTNMLINYTYGIMLISTVYMIVIYTNK